MYFFFDKIIIKKNTIPFFRFPKNLTIFRHFSFSTFQFSMLIIQNLQLVSRSILLERETYIVVSRSLQRFRNSSRDSLIRSNNSQSVLDCETRIGCYPNRKENLLSYFAYERSLIVSEIILQCSSILTFYGQVISSVHFMAVQSYLHVDL